jgi:hypothetical protein
MRYHLSRSLALAALLAWQSGCYNVYQPISSHRIQIRSDGVALKDGQKIKSLAEAVRGNAAAEAEVERGERAQTVGTAVFVSGLGATISGLLSTLALGAARKDAPPAALIVLSVTGVVFFTTTIVGMGYWHKGAVHERNAINRYNDDLAPCPSASPATPPAR